MTRKNYRADVVNESGYVVLFPDVAETEDVLLSYPPNPYAQSITQLFPLGTKLLRGIDEWWYCKNGGTNLAIAVPVQSAAAIHAEADDDIVVGAASAIGATTVTLTSTANLATAPLSTKDGFKEGYLVVNDEAGEGQCYKIKSHEAASSTSNFVVTLYDPLTIALTTASQVGLIQHPCAKVIVTAAVVSGIYIGQPLLAVTADYFFWAQHSGVRPAIPGTAIAKGTVVIAGTTAAKVTLGIDVATEVHLGYPITPAIADTETFLLF